MQTQPIPNRDPQLWRLAKARAGFKVHFMFYLLGVALMWAIWAFTWRGYMWPVWPTLGWGIGIVSHYIGAYRPGFGGLVSPEREYDRLAGNH